MPIYSAEQYENKHGHKRKTYPLPTDCATSNYPRLIHNEETWAFLQSVFHDEGYSSKSYHHRMTERYKNVWYSGIDTDYVAAQDNNDGRGRGVYAVRDIPKGTKIWYDKLTWVMNDGYWDSKEKMTNFLQRLPHDLQCDVTLWAYATSYTKKNNETKKIVECNLDEASYFNHGERAELVNFDALTSLTTRDIFMGEELLMDYSTFISFGKDSIPWWDEIRNTAWKASEYKEIETDTKDSNGVSQTNDSGTDGSSSWKDAIADDYVKYGAPNSMSSSTTTSSLHVEAYSTHGTYATNDCFGSLLAGLSMVYVLTRGLAMMRLRSRR